MYKGAQKLCVYIKPDPPQCAGSAQKVNLLPMILGIYSVTHVVRYYAQNLFILTYMIVLVCFNSFLVILDFLDLYVPVYSLRKYQENRQKYDCILAKSRPFIHMSAILQRSKYGRKRCSRRGVQESRNFRIDQNVFKQL